MGVGRGAMPMRMRMMILAAAAAAGGLVLRFIHVQTALLTTTTAATATFLPLYGKLVVEYDAIPPPLGPLPTASKAGTYPPTSFRNDDDNDDDKFPPFRLPL